MIAGAAMASGRAALMVHAEVRPSAAVKLDNPGALLSLKVGKVRPVVSVQPAARDGLPYTILSVDF